MALSPAAGICGDSQNHSDVDLDRDWANLADGPAGLIAELVLAHDVADYVRFRAVCCPWRRCSAEPRAHGGLDRRFHPRRWTMLSEKLAEPHRRRFLNLTTGECIQVDLPELRGHDVLAVTFEGLLVALLRQQPLSTRVHLLNPLTRHMVELPQLTTLLPPEKHSMLSDENTRFDYHFAAWGSGIANGSTVVLSLPSLRMLGMAKPGDEHWTSMKYKNSLQSAPSMFAGRFYCVTQDGVMVLDTGSAPAPPRLEVAAKLRRPISAMGDTFHLVDNGGELIFVRRFFTRANGPANGDDLKRTYDVCRVDLDVGRLCPAKSFGGGRALFMGIDHALMVSGEGFPSGCISGDAIYLSFDIKEQYKPEAYNLSDGRVEPARYTPDGSVAQPLSLVDCLSLCTTTRLTEDDDLAGIIY